MEEGNDQVAMDRMSICAIPLPLRAASRRRPWWTPHVTPSSRESAWGGEGTPVASPSSPLHTWCSSSPGPPPSRSLILLARHRHAFWFYLPACMTIYRRHKIRLIQRTFLAKATSFVLPPTALGMQSNIVKVEHLIIAAFPFPLMSLSTLQVR